MKKHFFILCACAFFISSCLDEKSTFLNIDTSSTHPTSRSSGDGKYEVIGYGYDITDEYLGETATKMQIIDVEAFHKNDDGHRYTSEYIGLIRQREFYAATSVEYINEIIKSSNYKGSVAYSATENAETKSTSTGSITSASFSGSITKGSTSKYTYSSKYSFGRADIVKKQRKYILDRKPNELTSYLTKAFKEDLTNLSADKIVLKYGTHVLLDITVGGMFTASYKSVIEETALSETKTKAVEAGIKIGYKRIGLDLSTTQTETQINAFNSKNTDWICIIDCWGGNTNGISTTITATEPPKTTFNYGSWAQSVDDTHSKLVDVNWDATYPIYDFIPDPTKKTQIKAAVEKYIKSKQLEIIEVIPLYEYYRSDKVDHFTTTVCYENHPDYKKQNPWIIGYVCKNQELGTIPLYEYYRSGKIDHFTTTVCYENHSDYKKQNPWIIGYVYKNNVSGLTVPLYEYYRSGKVDHFTTTVCYDNHPDYKKQNPWIIGYVMPK